MWWLNFSSPQFGHSTLLFTARPSCDLLIFLFEGVVFLFGTAIYNLVKMNVYKKKDQKTMFFFFYNFLYLKKETWSKLYLLSLLKCLTLDLKYLENFL